MIPISVSEKNKEKLDKINFNGTGSMDRANIIDYGMEAFDIRIRLLREAKEKLDIVYHIVRPGKTTEYFFGEVLNMADKGIKIRILVDGKFSGMISGPNRNISLALFNHPNIEYKFYNKLYLHNPWTWNTLLHDKFIIVDDKYYLTGGRNIGDTYFEPKGHTGRISYDRDIFVYNTGDYNESSIKQLQEYMELLWNQKETVDAFSRFGKKQKEIAMESYDYLIKNLDNLKLEYPHLYEKFTEEELMDYTVKTNNITIISNPVNTIKKEPIVGYVLSKLGLKANKSVMMQTPYATGNKKTLKILSKVGEKNMEFILLTNSVSSSPNFPAYSNYHANRRKFIKTGAKIYEFQNDRYSIHGKSYLFDNNISVVGSFNLDDRSIYIDTETMIIVDSPELYKILRSKLEHFMENSLVVDENNNYILDDNVKHFEASKTKKAIMFIASIFSRLFEFLI